MSLLVTLDGPVPVPALLRRLERLTGAVPRLRDRVRESPLGPAPPRWEADPGFSVERHLTGRDGPLEEVASSVVEEGFEPDRPPWRVVLPAASPECVVLHLHHSYTDGLGGMRLVGELLDTDPVPADYPEPGQPFGGPFDAPCHGPFDAPFGGAPEGRLGAPLVSDLGAEIGHGLQMLGRALPWAARTLDTARRRPADLLRTASEAIAALQVHAGAAAGPASPLLSARSAAVHLSRLDVDFEAMRTSARHIGVKVNDVFLAALLDGLQRYHAKHGRAAPSLRLAIPISSRPTGQPAVEMGNQLFGAVMKGPLGHLDFDERARLVHEMVLHGREQPWAPLVEDLAGLVTRLPGAVPVVGAAMASLDMLASNVAGPPVPMWLAGVPVTSMTPVGPRSGAALNVTLLSYGSTASVGINSDPASVPDPGVLRDCVAASFEEAFGA